MKKLLQAIKNFFTEDRRPYFNPDVVEVVFVRKDNDGNLFRLSLEGEDATKWNDYISNHCRQDRKAVDGFKALLPKWKMEKIS